MAVESINSTYLNMIAQRSPIDRSHKEQAAKPSENDTAAGISGKACGKRKMDAIELSSQPAASSPSLAKIKESLLSEIRKEKDPAYISALKARLASGQYTVDPQEIAGSMLSEKE